MEALWSTNLVLSIEYGVLSLGSTKRSKLSQNTNLLADLGELEVVWQAEMLAT